MNERLIIPRRSGKVQETAMQWLAHYVHKPEEWVAWYREACQIKRECDTLRGKLSAAENELRRLRKSEAEEVRACERARDEAFNARHAFIHKEEGLKELQKNWEDTLKEHEKYRQTIKTQQKEIEALKKKAAGPYADYMDFKEPFTKMVRKHMGCKHEDLKVWWDKPMAFWKASCTRCGPEEHGAYLPDVRDWAKRFCDTSPPRKWTQ